MLLEMHTTTFEKSLPKPNLYSYRFRGKPFLPSHKLTFKMHKVKDLGNFHKSCSLCIVEESWTRDFFRLAPKWISRRSGTGKAFLTKVGECISKIFKSIVPSKLISMAKIIKYASSFLCPKICKSSTFEV